MDEVQVEGEWQPASTTTWGVDGKIYDQMLNTGLQNYSQGP